MGYRTSRRRGRCAAELHRVDSYGRITDARAFLIRFLIFPRWRQTIGETDLLYMKEVTPTMKRIIRTGFLTLLLLFPLLMGWPIEAAVKAAPVSPALLDSLRQGGYILYVRHGEATVGQDRPGLVFSDCSTQRNLSERGRRQASDFGNTIRRLQIPVQYPVLASPFCRTRETAQLAFGPDRIQVDPFWINIYNLGGHLSTDEQNRIVHAMAAVLEKEPPAGANQVIVSHSFPQGVGLGDIPYLGTVIIKPQGSGRGYEVVGKYTLADLMNTR